MLDKLIDLINDSVRLSICKTVAGDVLKLRRVEETFRSFIEKILSKVSQIFSHNAIRFISRKCWLSMRKVFLC